MGDGDDVVQAQSASHGLGVPLRKIVTEMRAARFLPQGCEDGDAEGDHRRVGCRAVPLGKRQQIPDGFGQSRGMSDDAEMTGNDGPDSGEIGA